MDKGQGDYPEEVSYNIPRKYFSLQTDDKYF